MKSVITVKCPECRGTLEIDVARQQVLSHRAELDSEDPKQDKAALFDDVVKRVAEKESRAAAAFEKAQDDLKQNEDRLEQLFGEAKDKIKKQKESGIDITKDPRDLFWD